MILYRNLFILAALYLAGISAIANPYCQWDEKGQAHVQTRHYQLPEELSNSITALAHQLSHLRLQAETLKDEHLILTTPISPNHGLNTDQIESELLRLKPELESILNHLPTYRRTVSKRLMNIYFDIVKSLVFSKNMAKPYEASIEAPYQKYRLNIEHSSLTEAFPIGSQLIAGTDLQHSQDHSSIGLTRESFYRLMVQAMAQSQQTRSNKEAYFQTARCTLTRMYVQKLFQSQLLFKPSQSGLTPELLSSRVCMNTPLSEIISLEQDQNYYESILKARLLSELPLLLEFNDSDNSPSFSTYQTLTHVLDTDFLDLSMAYALAYRPEVLNAKMGYFPIARTPEFYSLTHRIFENIEYIYQNFPALAQYRTVLTSDSILPSIIEVMSSCGYEDESGIPLGDLPLIIQRAEDYFFLSLVYSDFMNHYFSLSDFDETSIQDYFTFYLKEIRKKSALMALELIVRILDNLNTPAFEEMDTLIANLVTDEIDNILNQKENDPSVRQFAQDLTKKTLQDLKERESLKGFQKAYAFSLVEDAQKVNHILDPTTPEDTLKYDFDAILRFLNPQLAQMSPDYFTRFDFVASQKNRPDRDKAWGLLKEKLNQDVEKQGISCGRITFGNRARGFFNSLLGSSEIQRNNQLKQDCDTIDTASGLLQLDNPNTPEDMSESMRFAREQFNNKEYKTFVSSYREDLADRIIDQERLLNYEVTNSTLLRRPKKLYEVITEVSEQEAWLLVQEAAKGSYHHILDTAKKLTRAETEDDLRDFVVRTTSLNAILGQYKLEDLAKSLSLTQYAESMDPLSETLMGLTTNTFTFPQLLYYHQNLQRRWDREFQANIEVKNETFMKVIFTNLGFIAPRLLSWVSGYVFRGGGAARFFNEIANSAFYTSSGLSGITFFYILGNIGEQQLQKVEYKTEREKAESLYLSDTIRTEVLTSLGASKSDPITASIDWSTYRNQKLYLNNLVKQANTNQMWSIAFSAMPIAFLGGAHVYGKSIQPRWAKRRSNQLLTLSRNDIIKIENKLARGHNRSLSYIKNDLARLGITNHGQLTVVQLQSRLNSIRQSGSPRQIHNAERAYENIIVTIGSRAQVLSSNQRLLEFYANTIYGNRASAHHFNDILREYSRLMRDGGGRR